MGGVRHTRQIVALDYIDKSDTWQSDTYTFAETIELLEGLFKYIKEREEGKYFQRWTLTARKTIFNLRPLRKKLKIMIYIEKL